MTVAQQIIRQLHVLPPVGAAGLEEVRGVNATLSSRPSWQQRVAVARAHFPSIDALAAGEVREAWLVALRSGYDDEVRLLGRILRDIFEYDQAVAGKPGPKPTVRDARRVHELFRQMVGDDHTTLPFVEIFQVLCNGRSIRAVAAKCGLNRNKVQRLLAGAGRGSTPTKEDLERIASGFRKDPSFFVEYRIRYLQDDLAHQLEQLPEASIDLYRRRVSR